MSRPRQLLCTLFAILSSARRRRTPRIRVSPSSHLPRYPRHQEVDYPDLAFRRDLRALGDLPPFRKAAAAAAGAGMLRLENRMPAHRGLPAVARRMRRSEPRADEILGVAANRLDALFRDVCPVRRGEVEPRPELRTGKLPERCCVVPRCHFTHRLWRKTSPRRSSTPFRMIEQKKRQPPQSTGDRGGGHCRGRSSLGFAPAVPCARQAPSCMRQKRLTVIGAPPQAFDTPARYFSTVSSPSAT